MFRSFDLDDPVSRLASLTNDLSGTTNDLSVTFGYNPASQITSTVRTGDTYAWTGHGNGSTAFTQNGLNQQITVGGSAATWDSKGNLTSEPQSAKTYGYSSENLLTSASGGVTLAYDPALRLYQVAGVATTRFAYDGVNAIAEYDGSNVLQRRFVFGPGVDQPIVQYEGSGTTDRRFMGSDERGSIISLTDSAGTLLTINRYDEYGKPQSTNSGRFQYTGQKWIGEIGAYDYKARDYLPHLGIFAQTDPIGYAGSPNLYAYVGDDPLNGTDPSGTFASPSEATSEAEAFRGSGRVWDWMGLMATHVGGRLDEMQLEQSQAQLQNAMLRLGEISAATGISPGCLLSTSGCSTGELLNFAQYRGVFHDEVVAQLQAHLNQAGVTTVREFQLCLGATCARADLFGRDPRSGQLFFTEVKTGPGARYTPNQLVVYGHAGLPDVFMTFDPRITRFGLSVATPLPPVFGFLYYVPKPGAPGVTVPIGH